MKFNEEQISTIMYEGGVYKDYDTEELLFETVDEDIIDTDTEKSSITIRFVIKELATGKFYSTELGRSPWCAQSEHNAKQEWREVKPKQIATTIYE